MCNIRKCVEPKLNLYGEEKKEKKNLLEKNTFFLYIC